MRNPIRNTTIEYNDNRISLFVAQKGKCSVTKEVLTLDDIHCHHKTPKKLGGSDNYSNLVIVSKNIHKLIHAVKKETIQRLLEVGTLNKSEIDKINKLRISAGNSVIEVLENILVVN